MANQGVYWILQEEKILLPKTGSSGELHPQESIECN